MDIIELSEYPHLPVKWNVTDLPTVVVDDGRKLVGPVSEDDLLRLITGSA